MLKKNIQSKELSIMRTYMILHLFRQPYMTGVTWKRTLALDLEYLILEEEQDGLYFSWLMRNYMQSHYFPEGNLTAG